MLNYLIRVTIEEQHSGRKVAEARVIMTDTMQDLMEPLKQSYGAFPVFNTPNEILNRTKRSRDCYAKQMGPKITAVLLEALSANDTFNGYTKEQNKQFYDPPTKDAK